MNVLYLTIFVLIALFVLENCKAKYFLVNINENTAEGFIKTNDVVRNTFITTSFRAGNGGTNKGNPSKVKTSKGEPSKRGPEKEDLSKERPGPSKKKKREESASDEGEGMFSNHKKNSAHLKYVLCVFMPS